MTTAAAKLKRFALPNGMTVNGLTSSDTMIVYRDKFEDKCYERHGVAFRDGDTILDVGANTGLFAVYLSTLVRSARVLSFEPIPETFAALTRNLAEHDRLNVSAFNVGVGDSDGSADFTYYPRFSNASTMFPDDSARTAETGRQYIIDQIPTLPQPLRFLCDVLPRFVKGFIADVVRRIHLQSRSVRCDVRSLSSIIREHKLERIDLLKIDAERSESRILAGLEDRDRAKVRQAIVEVHDGDAAVGETVRTLASWGLRAVVEPNPAMPGLALVYAVRDGARTET